MNRSLALGVLIGAAVGVVAGAIYGRTHCGHHAATPSPQVAAPPPPAIPPPAPAHDSEVDDLKRQLAEVKAALAAKEAPPPPIAPPAPPVDSERVAAAKLAERFARLADMGLGAFADPDFRKLLDDFKKRGDKGIEDLTAKLLRAESGGERFMASALLEGLADPSAIPALSESLGKDEDGLVRRMSSHALAMIGTEAALPALRSAMTSDKDWGVKVNAAYGVAKQGQADGARALEEAYLSKETPSQYHAIVFGALADVAAPSSAPIFRRVLAESTEIGYLLGSIGALLKMKDTASIAELNRVASTLSYPQNIREAAKKAADSIAK